MRRGSRKWYSCLMFCEAPYTLKLLRSNTHASLPLPNTHPPPVLYNHEPKILVSSQGLSPFFCQCRGFRSLLHIAAFLYPSFPCCHSPFSLPSPNHYFFVLHLWFTVFLTPLLPLPSFPHLKWWWQLLLVLQAESEKQGTNKHLD